MLKDDFPVIVYQVLSYLYGCLKEDRRIDPIELTAQRHSIPESYWSFIMQGLNDDGLIRGCGYTSRGFLYSSGHIEIAPKGIYYLFEHDMPIVLLEGI